MAYIYIGDILYFEDKKLYESKLNSLSKERRNKALLHKNENDRLLSVMAGVLLEKAMQDFDVHYPLIRDGLGYMHSAGKDKLFFSISHSKNLAVCVVSKFNIGIDIEDIHRFEKKKYLDINSGFSKRVLSEEEKIFLEQNCNSTTISNIWTRKESYSKILGKGIAMDLRTINTLNDSQFYSCETTDSNGDKYTISIAGDDITVNRIINFYF